jgi:hypothetical protein
MLTYNGRVMYGSRYPLMHSCLNVSFTVGKLKTFYFKETIQCMATKIICYVITRLFQLLLSVSLIQTKKHNPTVNKLGKLPEIHNMF